MTSRVIAPTPLNIAPTYGYISEPRSSGDASKSASAGGQVERKISPNVSPEALVITPRRSSIAALDGSLSAHAVRHAVEPDLPAAPLAHRPSLVRFNSGSRSKRSPA